MRGSAGAVLHSPAGTECWLQAGALGSLPARGELTGFSRHKLQCHFPALLTFSMLTLSEWHKFVTSPVCPSHCISCPLSHPSCCSMGIQGILPSLTSVPFSLSPPTLPVPVLPSQALSQPHLCTRAVSSTQGTALPPTSPHQHSEKHVAKVRPLPPRSEFQFLLKACKIIQKLYPSSPLNQQEAGDGAGTAGEAHTHCRKFQPKQLNP